MFRKDVILAMGAIEREYRATMFAIVDLVQRARTDPTVLNVTNIDQSNLRAARDNCETTYLVRMFAVFEESLREVRQIVYQRSSPIKTYDLIRQCAARQHVPEDHYANAQAVRDYRNSIVHGGEAQAVTFSQARSRLCTFFGWMPPRW